MLPKANNSPIHLSKPPCIFQILFFIAFDFFSPIRLKLIFPFGKLITVPEVSINKYSQARFGNYNIRLSRQIFTVKSISYAGSKKFFSNN